MRKTVSTFFNNIICAFIAIVIKGYSAKSNPMEKMPSNTTYFPSTHKLSLFPDHQLTTNVCNYANLQIPSIFSHLKFLSMAADSNQRFTIEMFRSMTMRNDSIIYDRNKWVTVVNDKYRTIENLTAYISEHYISEYLCGFNGMQDNRKSFVFSPFSIRALMAPIVIGMIRAISIENYPANRRIISYYLFPGMDLEAICLKSYKENYNDTSNLMSGMSSMIQYMTPKFTKSPNRMHQISMSNVMYKHKNLTMKDEYHDNFTSCLDLAVVTVDNFNQSVQNDIIKRFLLNPGFVSSLNISEDSKLVMLSSFNFSIELQFPFDEKKSKIHDFHTNYLPDDDYESYYTVKTPMLVQEGSYGFCKLPNATAIEMKYKGEDLSLVIILPDEGRTLYDIQPSMKNPWVTDGCRNNNTQPIHCGLDSAKTFKKCLHDATYLNDLRKCFKKMASNVKKMKILIPKFSLDQEYSLKQPFHRMATQSADMFKWLRTPWSLFLDRDHFLGTGRHKREGLVDSLNVYSRIYPRFSMFDFDNSDTFLTDVIHKVIFKMDSNKEVKYKLNGNSNKNAENSKNINTSQEFKCNRPFMFLVKEKETGNILISGRVTNPTNSSPTKRPKPKHSTQVKTTTQQASTKFTSPFLSTKPEPVTFTSVQSSIKREIDDQKTTSGCIKRKRIQETELAISFFLALYMIN